MAANMKQKEITTRQVASIQFGMYTDEEVRKLSVQRITSPLTYDNLNNIVSGGLYDPAMGPVDQNARCTTCGLSYNMCPGHFGHLELPVVVYNPLVFSMLYRLMKNTCLNCHQFKMGRQEMSKFLVKFSCLSRGDLVAASTIHTTQAQPSAKAVDDVMSGAAAGGAASSPASTDKAAAGSSKKGSSSSSKKGGKQQQQQDEEEEEEDGAAGLMADGDLGTGLGAYEAAYGEQGSARVQEMPKTLHIQEALRILVKEFFGRMPGAKCQNCGCLNPSIKKQGSSKLFKQYSRKALLQNFARGIDVAAAVAGGAAAAAAAMERVREPGLADADAAAAAAAGEGKKRKLEAGAGGDDSAYKKQGLVGDAFEGRTPVPAVVKKQLEEQEGWVVSEEEEEDDSEQQDEQQGAGGSAAKAAGAAAGGKKGGGMSKAKAAEAAAAARLGQQLNLDDAVKPKYMTPEEVEGHMRQLCYHESGILQHLFGGDKPAPLVQPSAHAAAAPPVSRKVRKQQQQQAQVEKAMDRLRQWRLQQHYSVLKQIHPELSAAAAEQGLAVQRRRARRGLAAAARAGPADLYRAFFLRALAVPPNRFRPPSVMGEQKYEHTQNITLQRILQAVINLQSIHQDMEAASAQQVAAGEAVGLSPAEVEQIAAARRLQAQQRFMAGWLKLQNEVNALIDSTAADNTDQSGVRQQLEKKEGLFRMNMMGKRVNYAARSVISPDPYIGAGEIGVPPYFAMRLSFPEAVTPHNVEHLRQLIRNGANSYPGAMAVEDCTGRVITLSKLDSKAREAIAKQLMLPSFTAGAKPGSGRKNKTVYRHLLDGDVMLTNRQPTLHKPSLMAHKARVLKGERTIRMHYANCSSFNADFDGDEINLHFPQDHLGRAEGYNIVHADRQFIVPTDGKPIRGLIQDHVVAGVEITCRDSFFTRAEFSQLLFAACTPWKPGATPSVHLALPPPAVLRPRQLWTGKQLISAVVDHYTDGRPPLTFSSGSKVPVSYWGPDSGEGDFVFHKGHLLAGCLDKAQFGKFGLVHAMQELYGDEVGGSMLNALSRLFTARLQATGFTCGMDDLLLTPAAEAARSKVLGKAEAAALAGSAEVVRAKLITATAIAQGQVPVHLAQKPGGKVSGLLNAERLMVAKQLEQHFSMNGAATGAVLDSKVTGVMHPLASEVIKGCIPRGQRKPFPANCMSLMTVSGAKGSTVNFSQIACLLGQQELEGRRVPRTASGKTLPCFRAYDGGARAGGFVGDRFLTGLRPQEYYFHCMAGREGLVDTTVKTSRSGYLQRCLVKNLESLRISYDGTVRDVCDGSVVQLYYGDDGLDVTKVAYLKQAEFMAANAGGLAQKLGLHLDPQQQQLSAAAAAGADGGGSSSKKKRKKQQQGSQEVSQLQVQLQQLGLLDDRQAAIAAAVQMRTKLLAQAQAGDGQARAQLQEQLPLMAKWFSSALGATSESFADSLERFCAAAPKNLLLTQDSSAAAAGVAATLAALQQAPADAGANGSSKKLRKRQAQLTHELVQKQLVAAESTVAQVDAQDFRWLQQLKFMSALAAPGEAVGVLAAQSVGEPSTQMTLNTFHMAGRGEANVTLGIPRLREILMTAAARIKTPTMTVPLLPGCDPSAARLLTARMRRLKLAETLKGIKVWERPAIAVGHMPTGEKWAKGYDLQLRFYDIQQYPEEAEVTWDKLERCLIDAFIPNLLTTLKKHLKKHYGGKGGGGKGGGMISSVSGMGAEDGGPGARAGGGDDDDEGGEGAAGSNRGAAKAAAAAGAEDDEDRPDEAAEDEEDDEEMREGKLRFSGGRGEAATYDAPDEDDAEAAAAVDAEMRERLGESSDDDESDEGDDATAGKRSSKKAGAAATKKQQQQGGASRSVSPDTDDAGASEEGEGPAAAGGKGSSASQRARQAAADVTGGFGRGRLMRGSAGGKKPDDPLLNYVVTEDTLTCTVEVIIPMDAPRILMLEVAEQVAAVTLLSHLPGIQAVHLLDPERPGQPQRLQTEGINFPGLWEQQALLDVNKLACNDVYAMLNTYGVEAARATILKEVQAVFGAYGIGVDPRHLGLIADFMTHTGGYRACNRLGIDSTTSPLLKMSYETAAKFLTDAALSGGCDSLTSPSARLVVGAVTEVGTGCCQLLHQG